MQTDLATTAALTTLAARVAAELAELLKREKLLVAAALVGADGRAFASVIAAELIQSGRFVHTDEEFIRALAFLIVRWGEGCHDAAIARALDTWGERGCAVCAITGYQGHRCESCREMDEVLS